MKNRPEEERFFLADLIGSMKFFCVVDKLTICVSLGSFINIVDIGHPWPNIHREHGFVGTASHTFTYHCFTILDSFCHKRMTIL